MLLGDKEKYIHCSCNLIDALNWQELQLEVALNHVNSCFQLCGNNCVNSGSCQQSSLDESSIHSHNCIGMHGNTARDRKYQF